MLMSLPSPPSARFALPSSLSSVEHFSLLPRASPLLLACGPWVSHLGHQALGHAPSPAEPPCQPRSRSSLLSQWAYQGVWKLLVSVGKTVVHFCGKQDAEVGLSHLGFTQIHTSEWLQREVDRLPLGLRLFVCHWPSFSFIRTQLSSQASKMALGPCFVRVWRSWDSFTCQ